MPRKQALRRLCSFVSMVALLSAASAQEVGADHEDAGDESAVQAPTPMPAPQAGSAVSPPAAPQAPRAPTPAPAPVPAAPDVAMPASTTPAMDPPERVGRLSLVAGTVLLKADGSEQWAEGLLNRPVTHGDTLWTESAAQAEVHVGTLAFRLADSTACLFSSLDDQNVSAHLGQGRVALRVREFDTHSVMTLATPNAEVNIANIGAYRVEYDPSRGETVVTVRQGAVAVACGSKRVEVNAGQSVTLAGPDCASVLAAAAPPDPFDGFCAERDRRDEQPQALNYVSRGTVGYEDLDGYGTWQTSSEYGAVWMPTGMPVGWAPYHYGRWVYISPWGWTWVDQAPWGFAPFHYGRWVYHGGWGWVPGGIMARPCYAPALVAFVGGGVGAVAWFALGPREVFVPAYRVSPVYTRHINHWEVRAAHGDIAVLSRRGPYINRTAPGAVVAVPVSVLQGGRPVGPAAFHTVPGALRGAPVAGFAPSVAPNRASFGGSVARPAPHVMMPQHYAPMPRAMPPAFRPYHGPAVAPVRPAPVYRPPMGGMRHFGGGRHR